MLYTCMSPPGIEPGHELQSLGSYHSNKGQWTELALTVMGV